MSLTSPDDLPYVLPDRGPDVVARLEAIAASLVGEHGADSYYERVFRERATERWRGDWTIHPPHEQLAYLTLLAAAVQTCDDVECDPVRTAAWAFNAIRPLLRAP